MSLFPPELKPKLRMPLMVMLALWGLLLFNSLLGVFIHNNIWYLEVPVAASMVAIVILFSMEAVKAAPIVRLFAGIGFFWVAIMFTLIMVDYATR
jgi:cytochrome c oxidase subunit 4